MKFRRIEAVLKVIPQTLTGAIRHVTESGQELLVLLQVPPGYLLNLATEDGLTPLKPQQRIRVKDGLRFFTQVPAGGSSR